MSRPEKRGKKRKRGNFGKCGLVNWYMTKTLPGPTTVQSTFLSKLQSDDWHHNHNQYTICQCNENSDQNDDDDEVGVSRVQSVHAACCLIAD